MVRCGRSRVMCPAASIKASHHITLPRRHVTGRNAAHGEGKEDMNNVTWWVGVGAVAVAREAAYTTRGRTEDKMKFWRWQ